MKFYVAESFQWKQSRSRQINKSCHRACEIVWCRLRVLLLLQRIVIVTHPSFVCDISKRTGLTMVGVPMCHNCEQLTACDIRHSGAQITPCVAHDGVIEPPPARALGGRHSPV